MVQLKRTSKQVGFIAILCCIANQFFSRYAAVLNNDKSAASNAKKYDAPSGTKSSETPRLLLLSVPFYVYEELAWLNATYGGWRNPVSAASSYKHADDFWFMKASLEHPMRTQNASQAKLFVVPILQNCYDRHWGENSLCWNNMCDNALWDYTVHILDQSPWFQNYPDRHIVVASHFRTASFKWKKSPSFVNASSKMNAITFEHHLQTDDNLLRMPTYYVGRACSLSQNKTLDVALIASLHEERETFQDRRNVCKWLGLGFNNRTMFLYSHCGGGEQCPSLAQAKLGFHVRGDTFGSNRLMDTLLSGTVPIFTRKEQYSILPSWIDWDQLSYFVDFEEVTHFNRFNNSIQQILQDDEGYQRRYDAVLRNRQLFNWSSLYPFDTYMYMLQAHLYPETRHATCDWSAMILPPT